MKRICATLTALLVALAVLSTSTTQAALIEILSEEFGDDPIAGGRATLSGVGAAARFTPAPGSLTASYETGLPTAFLNWSLGQTLDQSTDFRFEVDFAIDSTTFFADPNGFAQIAFGLLNSTTTGTNRSGGPGFSDGPDSFDLVSFDYFPNVSTTFLSGPTLGPTVVETLDGSLTSGFDHIRFFFGDETDLVNEAMNTDLAADGRLPFDVELTSTIAFDAATQQMVLTVRDQSTGDLLEINTLGGASFIPGGPDGDVTTIQLDLTSPDATFSVDTFGLTLWEDFFNFTGQPSATEADVTFNAFRVFAEGSNLSTVPEPSTFAILGWSLGVILLRRRQCR